MKVYYAQSSLSYSNTLTESTALLEKLFSRIGRSCEITPIDTAHSGKTAFVYIATGGTEGLFKQFYSKSAGVSKYIILCSGSANSLAASTEILTYLTREGSHGKIIYIADIEAAAKELELSVKCAEAAEKLCGMKLGQLGAPSDWLIASNVDAAALESRFGISTVSISLEEFFAEYQKKEYPISALIGDFLSHSFDSSEKQNALYVYGAIKRLVEKYGLSGITVRCFDMLTPTRTTGCAALALLNAEGIYAGCEGDMAALVTMTVAGALTGEPCFMCNPSRINVAENKMLLAHCTLPLNMPGEYSLMTHFESNIGVAFRGKIAEGAATLIRMSGDMRDFYAINAEILSNPSFADLCRTQIEIKAEKSLTRLLTAPLGNHQIIIKGHHSELIEAFLS